MPRMPDRVLAIIPARAASSRLPGKNTADLGGHPLIWWTLRAAVEAGYPFIVSTDDPAILALAREYGVAWDRRPPHLSLETTPSIDVVRYHWERHGRPEVTVLLQPTSPFRTGGHIREALAARVMHGAQSVVSVTGARVADTYSLGHFNRLERAEHSHGLWVANGAIYILGARALAAGHDWWSAEPRHGYPMGPEASLDIDMQPDLDRAREHMRGLQL